MKFSRIVVLLGVLLLSAKAEAYPLLQLDIIGGHYDSVTETIVSDGPDFTLVALLTPHGSAGAQIGQYLDTYYISAAVSPNVGPADVDLGSFSWNGTSYDVTDDMIYGRPPTELGGTAGSDAGDLQPHGIYPTFFREFGPISFIGAPRTVSYDAAEDPGGLTPSTTGGTYSGRSTSRRR